MPGESYWRRLGSSLLYLCYVFWALINSLVRWYCNPCQTPSGSLFCNLVLISMRIWSAACGHITVLGTASTDDGVTQCFRGSGRLVPWSFPPSRCRLFIQITHPGMSHKCKIMPIETKCIHAHTHTHTCEYTDYTKLKRTHNLNRQQTETWDEEHTCVEQKNGRSIALEKEKVEKKPALPACVAWAAALVICWAELQTASTCF